MSFFRQTNHFVPIDAFVNTHWAPKGQPHRKDSRLNSAKPVVIFSVISSLRGVVHCCFGEHSFNAEDICEALREVRASIGNGVPLALMIDNARIHRARVIQELMASDEVDIEVVWNVTARPDLVTVGID